MATHTILVVEDDPQLRVLISRALKEHGYDVRSAATGAEMQVQMDDGRPALIVLDIMLPGTNGIELLRRLRATSDVPVIFVSARGEEADRVVGLELGADDYLAKPFGTRELLARIAAVLRRHGNGNGAPSPREKHDEIGFDGWTLSLSRRELRSPTRALVELTTAEFDLLSAFVQSPQRVISRERLIELSRTRVGDSSDRSVDVLVSRLRRKLTTSDKEAPIATVRGVGYMFTAEVAAA
ncbi:response regulator [Croceicoccus marinus]|jgi:DNA-binding response OmpR family regulator|uniref:Regulatory protein VirG n=1 Tax=Croceicoccus marinus TaxID=450378 RepID=A0A7G6VRG0_9SPHN|nr:response regulator [Croceicoccus marinus]QNE04325.1 response regulator [Croceicoccus marinus]